ncbi:MAG: RND family efflux transporter MFP subunit [Candidatus Magasanikbacteria bacterium GW2011_GWA2_56_11]|uniref:RND family efflux transporter MFP subunit n=1 Tax=Candidatus Magasanikbacteria bacterium GW2011_GWA2_56_11 TaxID=1619044 RepID=A0A0G1YIM1_9BACT|nr:MAG: RND family efflux transporter MFP subunit [Candidatus Magasanikbacteria bacterium GW2011_GWA2_56_11]
MPMGRLAGFIFRHKITAVIVLGIAGIAGVMAWRSRASDSGTAVTVSVGRGRVVEEVSVTGKAQAAEAVDLAFESGGKVATVRVKVGDRVSAGAIISELASGDLAANIRRANASIVSAQADVSHYAAIVESEKVKLAELERGPRPEEVRIAESAVASAITALDDAREALVKTQEKADHSLAVLYESVDEVIHEAYSKASEALDKQVAPLFTGVPGNERLSFIVNSQQTEFDATVRKSAADRTLSDININISGLGSDEASRDAALLRAKSGLVSLRSFFDFLGSAVENSSLSASDRQTYSGYIASARTLNDSAISLLTGRQQDISEQRVDNLQTVQSAETAVNAAERALETKRRELELKQAGSSAEEVAAQRARLKQAEANLASARARIAQAAADRDGAQANYAKTVLRSPIAALVTKVDLEVGEIVPPNQTGVVLMSEAQYEIEAFVPEADIAKVAFGQTARVTLDAYGDAVTFAAAVTHIDPAETVIEGVAAYRVELQFSDKDERVKSGLTANVDIVTQEKGDVLVLPVRAVTAKNGGQFVAVMGAGGEPVERRIETGVRSVDGLVEIVSGLAEGETVVLDR